MEKRKYCFVNEILYCLYSGEGEFILCIKLFERMRYHWYQKYNKYMPYGAYIKYNEYINLYCMKYYFWMDKKICLGMQWFEKYKYL